MTSAHIALDGLFRDMARTRCKMLEIRNHLASRPIIHAGGPIINLTSHGKRLSNVYLAIESIGLGALLPSEITLWLDSNSVLALPRTITRLQRRGLEVKSSIDWGPHKKYYPYCLSANRMDSALITADDDVLYPRSWLSGLAAATSRDPEVMWCYRSRRIRLQQNGSGIEPYRYWTDAYSSEPSSLNFSTGVSGVALPPELLNRLKEAGDGFVGRCLFADDVWLNNHALRLGVKVGQVNELPCIYPTIPQTQDVALAIRNVDGGGNDAAISATYDKTDVQRLHRAWQTEARLTS
jgi:hypothetical protein